MNYELSNDQTDLLNGLEQVLEAEAPEIPTSPCHAFYSASLDGAMRDSGYLDIAREDGFGVLEAALVCERIARLPCTIEAAASAIVAPGLSIPSPKHPIAMTAGELTKPIRFLPMATLLLVDYGTHAEAVKVDAENVEALDTVMAYPYGRLKSVECPQMFTLELDVLRRRSRIAMAVEAAGCMAAALAHTVEHVKSRHAFGRPLGSFQAVQHRLAAAAETAEATRWLALRAAWSDSSLDAALAFGFAQSRIAQVTYDLHQFCGAMGLTLEFALHFWTYRLRALAGELGGASGQMKDIAGLTWGTAA